MVREAGMVGSEEDALLEAGWCSRVRGAPGVVQARRMV